MADLNESQDPRYAPPRSHVEDVPVPGAGPVLAARSQRFWAAMIDLGIAIGCFWLASVTTPWNPWEGAQERSLWTPMLLDAVIGFAIFLVVHGVLLARRGQTVGKAVLGIRITRSDGSAASLGRLAGLRYGVGSAINIVPALGQMFGLVDALMIFRASRRCLHDLIADTIVVKA